jgi:hypothetical protein
MKRNKMLAGFCRGSWCSTATLALSGESHKSAVERLSLHRMFLMYLTVHDVPQYVGPPNRNRGRGGGLL